MKIVLFLAICVIAISATTLGDTFNDWMVKYNKKYATEEETQMRMNIFHENILKIAQLNAKANSHKSSAKFGLNKFADMDSKEFDTKFKGYKSMKNLRATHSTPSSAFVGAPLPSSFDWRTYKTKVVSAVKDQEQCGSCWAFSATEGTESAWALAGNKLVALAPQQIVDCDTSDSGCNGGDLPTAFAYIEANGLEAEASYPYTGEDGTCAYDKSEVVAQITGWGYATQSGNETEMQANSFVHGPLSICVDAETWQTYTSGVITSDCSNSLDHCVQIVGWGSSNNVPYWIIRNSWGADWGISGYIWVERNQDLCGVADEATYVTASKASKN